MLNFFGRGSANNFAENTTSAYFAEDGKLFIIDCSEVTARQILSSGVLNNIFGVFLCATHTHGDHFSGCGTLAGLLEYEHKISLSIVLDSNARHILQVEQELKNKGVQNAVRYVDFNELKNKFRTFKSAKYVPTTHSTDGVESHGIQFETPNGIVYYSGDTNEIDRVAEIAKDKRLAKLYVDTSSVDTTWHITLRQLEENIPPKLRTNVLAMHIDRDFSEDKAAKIGFRIVSIANN